MEKVEKRRMDWDKDKGWIAHISRHESLLLDIIEGQMKGRPTRGRRRLQMLDMLARDDYVAMK